MKRLFLLPALCFVFHTTGFAADSDPAPPAAHTPDFSSFKTADDLWKEMEKLQQPPEKKPTTREEAMQQIHEWFTTQKAASDAFVKQYPADSRSWQARLISLRAAMQLRRFSGEATDPAADQLKLDEIINAPDAPAPIKGEATFMRVLTMAREIDKSKPETSAAFLKAAGDFLAKYPDHPLAARMKNIEVQLLSDDISEAGAAALKKLAADPDKDLAAQAQAALARQQKMADLKTKPIDLKFTAADGHDIDLANYRGKVVLLDFWASWCGPCMGEMPNVVSTYGKLHDKGFEIVGISLDQNKEDMDGALKKQNMTWPQYFDGGGWQNKIANTFGVQAIPAAFLFDKKGMLRETGLRGEALGEAVEKLLAE
jgi:thiol-disulfide isomerase/thioredoxin